MSSEYFIAIELVNELGEQLDRSYFDLHDHLNAVDTYKDLPLNDDHHNEISLVRIRELKNGETHHHRLHFLAESHGFRMISDTDHVPAIKCPAKYSDLICTLIDLTK